MENNIAVYPEKITLSLFIQILCERGGGEKFTTASADFALGLEDLSANHARTVHSVSADDKSDGGRELLVFCLISKV